LLSGLIQGSFEAFPKGVRAGPDREGLPEKIGFIGEIILASRLIGGADQLPDLFVALSGFYCLIQGGLKPSPFRRRL